jgi:hypothetical protein
MTSDLATNNRPSIDGHRDAANSVVDASSRRPSLVDRVVREAASGHYDQALHVAYEEDGTQQDPLMANTVGVCLLRLGRVNEAVGHYHSLLFGPGCTAMRRDRPAYIKLNYATALLLSSQVDACLGVLQEVGDRSATARRLREAIERWELTLSFGQKLDWWINRIAPSGKMVAIDFVPGDFGLDEPLDSPPLTPVRPSQPPACTSEAVQLSTLS